MREQLEKPTWLEMTWAGRFLPMALQHTPPGLPKKNSPSVTQSVSIRESLQLINSPITFQINMHFNYFPVFNWTGTHNVGEVSKEDYDNCTTVHLVDEIQQISPATFTLDSNGSRFFICTVDSHCERGQKVTINIGEYSFASSMTVSSMSAIFSILTLLFISSYYL